MTPFGLIVWALAVGVAVIIVGLCVGVALITIATARNANTTTTKEN